MPLVRIIVKHSAIFMPGMPSSASCMVFLLNDGFAPTTFIALRYAGPRERLSNLKNREQVFRLNATRRGRARVATEAQSHDSLHLWTTVC